MDKIPILFSSFSIKDTRISQYIIFILLILLLFLPAGCQSQDNVPTLTPWPTLTPAPTQTPTPAPHGSESNPIVLGMVGDQTNENLIAAGEYLSRFLSEGSDQNFSYKIVPTYGILISEMTKSAVHIYFLPPMTYLYVSSRNLANAQLLLNHFGLYKHGSQFFVHSNSGLFPYFDETTQSNIGDTGTALAQLNGKRPCYVSPDSVAGYLVPAAILHQNGILTQKPVFTFSSTATIRSLYISGVCDFGAAFAVSGDPRTSPSVISDLTDVKERIPVMWRSDPVIPAMNISFHPALTERTAQSILTSFIVLGQTQEGNAWLQQAAHYEISDLMIADDSTYSELRALLEDFEYDTDTFIGQ